MQDAHDFQQLAGRREIADTMISIPHPCSLFQAQHWITTQCNASADGKCLPLAIESNCSRQLVGTVALRDIDQIHSCAELGIWIGSDWWGLGFGTEAARAIIRYAFDSLALNRVCAHHMVRNPASGRMLEKAGMKREGLLRQAVRKWGTFEDVVLLAILRSD